MEEEHGDYGDVEDRGTDPVEKGGIVASIRVGGHVTYHDPCRPP